MSMRVNTIVTHLRPEEALTLIEFLDQVREVLMRSYGDDVKAMLQQAATTPKPGSADREEEPF